VLTDGRTDVAQQTRIHNTSRRPQILSCFKISYATKCASGRGSGPDPAGRAHVAPPHPLVGWGGNTPPHTPPSALAMYSSRISARSTPITRLRKRTELSQCQRWITNGSEILRVLDQKQLNIFGQISLFLSVKLQGQPSQLNGGDHVYNHNTFMSSNTQGYQPKILKQSFHVAFPFSRASRNVAK